MRGVYGNARKRIAVGAPRIQEPANVAPLIIVGLGGALLVAILRDESRLNRRG